MNWLNKINRRHIALIATVPVLSAIIGFSLLARNAGSKSIKATPCGIFGFDPGAAPYGPQLADILKNTGSLQASIFDYPYPVQLIRSALASRAGITSRFLDWRQFKDELASYEVELRSDDSEITNVELASDAINGIVVQPCETFSFNSVVGERSEERGFQPGLMFSKGQVVTGVGGGVCIVSTALYNTAVQAGCKIIERSHHSGPVRYAQPGLDAAVVFGLLDMQFKNDTGAPILIRSHVQDSKLVVSLSGRKRPGFDVEVISEDYKELPYKIIETEDPSVPQGTTNVQVAARPGFEVTTVRLFKQDGKTLKREVLSKDVIAPRDKIVLVPPSINGQPEEIGSSAKEPEEIGSDKKDPEWSCASSQPKSVEPAPKEQSDKDNRSAGEETSKKDSSEPTVDVTVESRK